MELLFREKKHQGEMQCFPPPGTWQKQSFCISDGMLGLWMTQLASHRF